MIDVDFLSVREDVDPDKIKNHGCGWGGMAMDATVASTMYDMNQCQF